MKREIAIKIIAQNQIRNLTKSERESFLMEWWVEDDEDYQRIPQIIKDEIPNCLKLEIEKNGKYGDVENKKYDPIILMGIYHEFRGVKNSYLEKEIQKLKNKEIIVEGVVEELEKCPCCDYRTLDKKCDWEICKVCFWEDDCTLNLDEISGANHITLREGKENFLKFGACDKKSIELVDKAGKSKYKI